MNTSEENNLPLFKYTPEITSQLLIQTSEPQEFVQASNICDDLLLTELDGTVTWTFGGLPVLLNSQNDQETVGTLNSSEETLRDILDQGASEDQFVGNNIEISNNEGITYPLTISDKNFLTDSNLFVTNEVIDDQVDASNCDLVSNDNNSSSTEIIKEEECESEIQSSDVSSQEAFIDINGLLISEQSVLNLNCPDLLFNIQEPQNIILNDDSNLKIKTKIDLKSRIFSSKNDSQNYEVEETVENIQREVQNSSVFSYDESVSSYVMNVNIDGTLLNSNSTSKDIEFPVDDEPDSTVSNDLLNIDDLATIITAYQCKKCDFTCNDRDQFLTHFRDAHIQVYEVQPDCLLPTNLEEVRKESQDEKHELKQKNNNIISTISILYENGEEVLGLNTEIISKNDAIETTSEVNILEETSEVDTNLNIPENLQNVIHFQENNIPTKLIFANDEFPAVTLVPEETEKKIMRIKNRKKYPKRTKEKTEQKEVYVPQFVFVEEGENTTEISEDLPTSTENAELEPKKQLIYLCSQCADEFLTVEDCRAHMIQIHNLCAAESIENFDSAAQKTPEQEKIDTLQIEDSLSNKNKKWFDKILGHDTLKSRRHKCHIKGCPYRFAKLELLARHEACHVDGNRSQFRCPECEEVQSCWRACSVHLWRCHQVDLDLYACPLCDYRGSTSVKLKHHIKIHSDDREYVCPECGKGFKQPSQLRNHRVIHLEKQPAWYTQKHCDKCGKMFADSKCLKKHIQAVHSKLKPFICNVCGHTCARKAMLQMHLRQHTGEKPYSCSLCYYKTGDHNSLRRHKMRHSGTRPYKCPHCEYTAIQSNSYKNHLSSKHPGMPGAYNCQECTFKTINEEVFESHLNDHKNNLIDKRKSRERRKITLVSLLNVLSNSSSESTNENEIFAGSGGSGQINIISKKNIDLEDEETQNCFLSLSDLTDEQTVDTGGITIPAEPDDPNHLNL